MNKDNNHKCCSTHCCDIHGCKYGYDDCPVVLKQVKQEYPCEDCSFEYGYASAYYTQDEITKELIYHMSDSEKIKKLETENQALREELAILRKQRLQNYF